MLFVYASHLNKYFRWRRMQLNTTRLTPRLTLTKTEITSRQNAFGRNKIIIEYIESV